MSPDQKGIETRSVYSIVLWRAFTMSPDQKGIETCVGLPPGRRHDGSQ